MQGDRLESFLHELCDLADAETLPRFRQGMEIDNKLDAGFDPVTIADREAEAAIRRAIMERHPDHGIAGEEHGNHNAGAALQWIIDPIDGTRAFICGLPSWGTLIGLVEHDRALAGIMSQPFTGERYFACNGTAWLSHHGRRTRLASRKTARLADAVMMTTSPFIFEAAELPIYGRLEKSCRMTRYGFDCYAYAMVAAGQIDLVAEASLQPYDIAPLIPIIEAAGGVVTTWDGSPARNGGRILAAANPSLHAQAVEILAAGQ